MIFHGLLNTHTNFSFILFFFYLNTIHHIKHSTPNRKKNIKKMNNTNFIQNTFLPLYLKLFFLSFKISTKTINVTKNSNFRINLKARPVTTRHHHQLTILCGSLCCNSKISTEQTQTEFIFVYEM